MIKVKKIIENKAQAEKEYVKMEYSGDFDKIEKQQIGTKGYTMLCGFSNKDYHTMKIKLWSESVLLEDAVLFKDEDYQRMYNKIPTEPEDFPKIDMEEYEKELEEIEI